MNLDKREWKTTRPIPECHPLARTGTRRCPYRRTPRPSSVARTGTRHWPYRRTQREGPVLEMYWAQGLHLYGCEAYASVFGSSNVVSLLPGAGTRPLDSEMRTIMPPISTHRPYEAPMAKRGRRKFSP